VTKIKSYFTEVANEEVVKPPENFEKQSPKITNIRGVYRALECRFKFPKRNINDCSTLDTSICRSVIFSNDEAPRRTSSTLLHLLLIPKRISSTLLHLLLIPKRISSTLLRLLLIPKRISSTLLHLLLIPKRISSMLLRLLLIPLFGGSG